MGPTRGEPKATVVVDVGDQVVVLGQVCLTTPCDLRLVDDVLQLRLAALRLGWSVRLARVDVSLRELVELVGLADQLLGDPGSNVTSARAPAADAPPEPVTDPEDDGSGRGQGGDGQHGNGPAG